MSNFFGQNLKALRIEKEFSQAQLGEALAKSHKTIGNWETGYSEPGLDDLINISNFFCVDLNRLLKCGMAGENPESTYTCEWSGCNRNPNENLLNAVSETKRVLLKELNDGNPTSDDEISLRDQYIVILENRLCEAAIASVSQQTFQDVVSKFLTLQETVLELMAAQPEDRGEAGRKKTNTKDKETCKTLSDTSTTVVCKQNMSMINSYKPQGT